MDILSLMKCSVVGHMPVSAICFLQATCGLIKTASYFGKNRALITFVLALLNPEKVNVVD